MPLPRFLCLRFPNWPIQVLRVRLRDSGEPSELVALHTLAPSERREKSAKATTDVDLRFIRELWPAAVSGPTIVAVSTAAWHRGVRPGMPLAEARSMAVPLEQTRRDKAQPARKQRGEQKSEVIPQVGFFEWQSEDDRRQLILLAEPARKYAPVIGLDELPVPDCLLLDITGCAPLFGGEAALAESLLADIRRAGYSARMAIADTVAAAWALAHVDERLADKQRSRGSVPKNALPEDLPIRISPPGQARAELKFLPIGVGRLPLADQEILQNLGIRSLGQLLSLPLPDLPSRLSDQSVVRIQQLNETVEEGINPIPEQNPVMAEWSSDEPATGYQDLQYIIGQLCPSIEEQLVRRRVACSQVECEFRSPGDVNQTMTAGVVKPTQSAQLLSEVLSLRLEFLITNALRAQQRSQNATQRASGASSAESAPGSIVEGEEFLQLLDRPVHAVKLVATSVPLPVSRQRDLFSSSEHVVPDEELATLVARLSGRLGAENVLKATLQPDPRPEHSLQLSPILASEHSGSAQTQKDSLLRAMVTPDMDDSSKRSLPVPRPLQLLEVPLPIGSLEGKRDALSIQVLGQRYELSDWSAPERIQTGWWTDSPCHRDYYQVQTLQGSRLWIYRDLNTHTWFLHGFFS